MFCNYVGRTSVRHDLATRPNSVIPTPVIPNLIGLHALGVDPEKRPCSAKNMAFLNPVIAR